MIIVRLKGGLGNQMFQYAIGRKYMQMHNGNQVKLDDYTKKAGIQRDLMLTRYKIRGSVLNKPEYYIYRITNALGTRVSFLKNWAYKIYFQDQTHAYEDFYLQGGKNVYLDGFWQNLKYFDDIKEILKDEFQLKDAPTKYSQELLEKINNSNAICLHVRRGDYVSNSHTNSVHGTAPMDYYNNAIAYINSHVENPNYFLFSDDPDWAKENIKTNSPTEVSYNPIELGYEDLALMNACKHYIIANSTFSWWGAYLSRNPNKIVCAPKRWYNDKENPIDLIPENWIKF
ncbi:MAG: alpha-1,2-fucosyltransferase [Candidatus Dojkabacteria bacterium]